MKEKLTNNWLLKLFALVVAIMVWLMVINIDDTLIPGSVTVPVKVINEQVMAENGLAYWVTENTTVKVSFKARQTKINLIKASDFELTADLSDWHPGFSTVPIKVNIVNNGDIITDYSSSDSVLKIRTEELDTKEMRITPVPQGQVEEGYTLGEAICNPADVQITAPVSTLKIISKVAAEIDVSSAVGERAETCNLIVYDGNGDPLDLEESKITLNHAQTQVSVPVLKTNTVPVVVSNVIGQGNEAAGYRYIGPPVVSTQNVSISGPRAVLNDLTSIVLRSDKLNVTGVSGNVEVELDLYDFLPDGVELVGMKSSKVQVILRVEPLQSKTLFISWPEITINNPIEGMEYSLQNDEKVSVSIIGLQDELDQLTVADIKPTLDVRGLSEGTHQVQLRLSLGDGLSLAETPSVNILVKTKVEAPLEPSGDVNGGGEPSQTPGESSAPTESGGEATTANSTELPSQATTAVANSTEKTSQETAAVDATPTETGESEETESTTGQSSGESGPKAE